MPKRSRKKEDANEIAYRVVRESVRERPERTGSDTERAQPKAKTDKKRGR
ncbi:MAG: hypothetical protein KGI71_05425 [Patescibacteria group bacterium]|nr:hypothetical protein [Patescibacteria group bacterium]